MAESMREAVEGSERDLEARRREDEINRAARAAGNIEQRHLEQVQHRKSPKAQAALANTTRVLREEEELQARKALIVSHFRRADVHDCITAANEQRQLAIASPKSAEQANALATRLSDLAERIAALLEEGE